MIDCRDVRFKWEWLPANEIKAPELRATWARLEIYVGVSCLTLVEDVESSSSRRSVLLPLYPLAEWIAFNWWSLIADARPAGLMSRFGEHSDPLFEPSAKDHRARHGLRSAGDGFLWPNLLILPQGTTTHLSWRADAGVDPAYPIKYLTSGECTTSAQDLQQKLSHLVEAVITRLNELGVSATTLESEWRAIQGADEEEVAYCVAAARLGLDPYSEAADYEAEILAAASSLPGGLLADFLDAVEPARISETLDWVRRTADQIAELPAAGTRDVMRLRAAVGQSSRGAQVPQVSLPWETGWRQAREVRRALAVDDISPVQVEGLVTSVDRSAPTRSMQAIGTLTGNTVNPLVAVGRAQRSTTRRFTLARALWHLLWEEPQTFLVTTAYTDRQRVERAFAAELLAPASGIARMVDGDTLTNIDEDSIEDIAGSYDVSPMLVKHQIDNQLVPSLP